MMTENPNNSRKWAADMTVEELQVELAEMNHAVINFREDMKYADHFKNNGRNMKARTGSGLVMKRRHTQ